LATANPAQQTRNSCPRQTRRRDRRGYLNKAAIAASPDDRETGIKGTKMMRRLALLFLGGMMVQEKMAFWVLF
jgi:hypothetical protein